MFYDVQEKFTEDSYKHETYAAWLKMINNE